MYTGIPPRQRRSIIASLALGWMLAGAAGISATMVSPNTIVAELGPILVNIWGVVVALSALAATYGVLFERYRLEWPAAWLAAAGTVPYVGTVWWLVIIGETTRLTQAFMVSSLIVFFIHRALSCAAHAAKLRARHREANGDG